MNVKFDHKTLHQYHQFHSHCFSGFSSQDFPRFSIPPGRKNSLDVFHLLQLVEAHLPVSDPAVFRSHGLAKWGRSMGDQWVINGRWQNDPWISPKSFFLGGYHGLSLICLSFSVLCYMVPKRVCIDSIDLSFLTFYCSVIITQDTSQISNSSSIAQRLHPGPMVFIQKKHIKARFPPKKMERKIFYWLNLCPTKLASSTSSRAADEPSFLSTADVGIIQFQEQPLFFFYNKL